MRMYDLISKKKNGIPLTDEEIKAFVSGFMAGEIPDYQVSAFLMAGYIYSMTPKETTALTIEMAKSGECLDLKKYFHKFTVDKHSTGGVGDKTTLIVGPIVAACGVLVPKMSGKGLGHTGGTIDKLQSIPNFRTDLSLEEFVEVVKKCGVSVVSQTAELAPADKKIYALRDATATVDSIPLISSSIMSKKLAMGADALVLDVKVGSGAFMKTITEARKLAESMVSTALSAGKKCRAILTNMDAPLGKCIGNSLEVIEAIEVLKGKVTSNLYEISIELAANMLFLAEKGSLDDCRKLSKEAISSGKAIEVFRQMIALQGGKSDVIDDYSLFERPKFSKEIFADKDGFVSEINCEECGLSAQILGAGRATKDAEIDFTAGIVLNKVLGEKVRKDELLATFYSSVTDDFSEAEQRFLAAYIIGEKIPKLIPIILE
ncbi:MAG: thymidine phosphorylase [Oscillospiraceae bacterium]